MNKIELLIFDLDGTLVDSRKDIANAINYSLKTLGFTEKDVGTITGYVGEGLKSTMYKALDNAHDEVLDKAVELFRNYYIIHPVDHARLYPGVEDFLKNSSSIKKAVLSNKDHAICVKTLELLDVNRYFEIVVGGDNYNCRKPDPCSLIKIMEYTKVPKEKILMVGDMDSDINAGKNAGVKTCAVTYGFRKRDELEGHNPDYIIDGILELKNILN
ncbi:MAG: HAD-IA family hydrolase [Endomicrobiales bacterium]|nr:HAD-IA family hydrolase [Endomicrobiales bacterium]